MDKLNEFLAEAEAQVLLIVAGLGEESRTVLLADWELAKALLISTLSAKTAFWKVLPWLLCGLLHPDSTLVKLCAQECLRQFDSSDPESHHHLARKYLSIGSELRGCVEALAQGTQRPSSTLHYVIPAAQIHCMCRACDRRATWHDH